MSTVLSRPSSLRGHTMPGSTWTGSVWPVRRSTGSRAPDKPMIGEPVVAEARWLSVSAEAMSSRSWGERQQAGLAEVADAAHGVRHVYERNEVELQVEVVEHIAVCVRAEPGVP